MRASRRSTRLRATAALTAALLLASPLLASAATWSNGGKCARPSARKIGCHPAKPAVQPPAPKIGCHHGKASQSASELGSPDTPAKMAGGKGKCCCRTTGAISASHCGCRHDGAPAMMREAALPPTVTLLRGVQPQASCSQRDSLAPDGLCPVPPDPPPRAAETAIVTV